MNPPVVSQYWPRFARSVSGMIRYGVGTFRLARKAIVQWQAAQRTWELMALIDIVRRLRPGVTVEIGTKYGGTLYCWAQVAPADATLISLDLPGGDFGGGCSAEHMATFQSFLGPAQTLRCLRADSHAKATVDELKEFLAGRPVNFLFIDGDHTYEGVKTDFEMYSPLVARGGVIAFHDILPNPLSPNIEVPRFWQELKTRYAVQEVIDRYGSNNYGMGIGVITWS